MGVGLWCQIFFYFYLSKKKKMESFVFEEEYIDLEEFEEVVENREENEQLNQFMERVNEIENDFLRIKIGIDIFKKQMQELRDEIDRFDKIIKDVMMFYEVISQEINLFKEQMSQENLFFSEIQDIRKEFEDFKFEIVQIKNDIKVFVGYGVDLDLIIYEVLVEV